MAEMRKPRTSCIT